LSCRRRRHLGVSTKILHYVQDDSIKSTLFTNSTTIGETKNLVVTPINQVLDLTHSSRDYDSLTYAVKVSGIIRFNINVKRERQKDEQGAIIWENKGVYCVEMDSLLLLGRKHSNATYAYQMGEELSFETLFSFGYHPDLFYLYRWLNLDVQLVYDRYSKASSPNWQQVRAWKVYSGSINDFGEGYLCFRYLTDKKDRQIKYGWLKLNIASSEKLEIIELAYMK